MPIDSWYWFCRDRYGLYDALTDVYTIRGRKFSGVFFDSCIDDPVFKTWNEV